MSDNTDTQQSEQDTAKFVEQISLDIIELHDLRHGSADGAQENLVRETVKATVEACGGPPRKVDIESMAVSLFEKSHHPSFSDDSRGMQEARDYALHLVSTYMGSA